MAREESDLGLGRAALGDVLMRRDPSAARQRLDMDARSCVRWLSSTDRVTRHAFANDAIDERQVFGDGLIGETPAAMRSSAISVSDMPGLDRLGRQIVEFAVTPVVNDQLACRRCRNKRPGTGWPGSHPIARARCPARHFSWPATVPTTRGDGTGLANSRSRAITQMTEEMPPRMTQIRCWYHSDQDIGFGDGCLDDERQVAQRMHRGDDRCRIEIHRMRDTCRRPGRQSHTTATDPGSSLPISSSRGG